MNQFSKYRRKQIAELRPYVPGEMIDYISISVEDMKAGSPKPGDMVARNPKNHADQWFVAAQYFADNFEPVQGWSGAETMGANATARPAPQQSARKLLPEAPDAERFRDALERIALLDEADGHELTVSHAFQAVGIATQTLGKHPSEIHAERYRRIDGEHGAKG